MSIRNRISRQEPLSAEQEQQLTSLSNMEPHFAPKATTPQSSKTELFIGGLRVYVYGLEEAQKQGYSDVAVLYLAHGRTRDYGDMEMVAHEILDRYGNAEGRKSAGLIAVALDMRNHGERKLSEKSNDTWDLGNEFHAQDILSVISGSAQDFGLLMDYLPTYLPQFNKFYNVMSGVSLGGHTSWRLGTNSSSKLHGLAIIIGCPNLAALLLNRLGVDLNALSLLADDVYKIPYDKVSELLTEEQRRRWPRALHDLVAELDRNTTEKFPKDVPTYILNGKLDPLVPDRFTEAWVAKRKAEGYTNLDHLAQDNTGHACTQAMVDNVVAWLVKLFT